MHRSLSKLTAARALLVLGAIAGVAVTTSVHAQEKFTYLFPAPPSLAAFAPFHVARAKGYYKQEGLEVEFKMAKGGAEVANQLVAGNAVAGGAAGDTAIVLRPAGVPVKTIALLGGKSLMQLVMRRDAGIAEPNDLRGKTISVPALTDTTYFALLGFLKSVSVGRDEVTIVAKGPVDVFKSVIAKEAQVMAGVPDWIVPIKEAGVDTVVFRSDQFFPSMAQAIIASDKTIQDNPESLRAFVRATLRGMKDILDDPESAATLFVKNVAEHAKNPNAAKEVIRYYATYVYPGQKVLGEVSTYRLGKLQEFYLDQQIIKKETPLKELYTHQFLN